MGVSAAVVGFRQAVERGSVVVQTDDWLVGRARAGDDAAFEAIYDRYARGVLAFCVHMLGSRESAEDALQLTFVSAYRALRGGESNISLRPWLYTIARNRCLSELRTRREGVDVDGVALDRPCFEGLADQVQRREQLREMLEDMQRLPADQRAALVLFELGDHSHKEIAAALGVRTEKVKALIFQAREALVRGRQARDRPCAEIRERLATSRGRVLARSMTRAHIDRCPSCAAFEGEVRHQRAALALILPVTLTGGLKASVLGSALRGGGTVAAGAGACGSGAAVAGGATTAGGAGGAGGLVAGGATAAGGAGAVAAGTGAASTAVIAGAPSVAAVATGLTAVGADYAASAGVGGLGATGVLAKILTVAAIATGGAGAIHASSHRPHLLPGPPAALQLPTTSASPATAPTVASNPAATAPAVTPSATTTTTTTTPAATPSATTTTTTTPAATPSATTTTTTTPAATPSATTTTTTTPAATPSATTTTTTTPAATPSATTTTTTTPAATPSATTTTTTTPAATPSATTTTTTTPAATPSATTTTTTTTPATPSATTTTTTTTPAATPSATTPPNEAPAATDPVPVPTTAQAMVDAIAPTGATSG